MASATTSSTMSPPLTNNVSPFHPMLPEPVGLVLTDVCNLLLQSNSCCRNFLNFDITGDQKCLTLGITKALGYGIIIASTLVKLPQLLKILKAQSGVGISVMGVLLELMSITFSTSYSYGKGFPFTAWGEALFLLVETALIAFFVMWFDGKKGLGLLFLLTHSSIVYVMMSGLTPIKVLWSCQAFNLPLAIAGKMLQGLNNWRAGHTGQMSAITMWCLFIGCIVRVFTNIQETGDLLVIMTFSVSAVANLILVSQIHYYWKATDEHLKRITEKKHH